MYLGLINKRTSSHRFIISGTNSEITPEKIQFYKDSIYKLGGTFLDCSTEQFISSCTHVLCISFISSVKIMGGLASGKWLVDKTYIDDSVRNNKFLPEDKYEVSYYNNIAKHCRQLNGQLYSDYCFYLETANNYKSYKRVFVAGGAMVLNKEEAIAKNYKIDFAFCDEPSYPSVKAILSNRPTVPILNLEYMRFTIFLKHNPRDFKQFLVDKSQNIEIIGTSLDQNEKGNKQVQELLKRVSSHRKLPLTPRTVKRTTARRSSNVQGTILPYLVNTNSPNNQIGGLNDYAKKLRAQGSDSSDEIEIIGEYPSRSRNIAQHCLDNSTIDILHTSQLRPFSSQISSSGESDVIPINEVKHNLNVSVIKKSVQKIEDNPQHEVKNVILEKHCINNILPHTKVAPSDSKKYPQGELLVLNNNDALAFLHKKENEENYCNEINNVDMLEIIPNQDPTNKMEVQELMLESVDKDVLTDSMENTSVDPAASPNNNLRLLSSDRNKKEIGISDAYTPKCDNIDITKQKVMKTSKSEKKEIFLQNKTSLLQAGRHTIKLDFHVLISTYRKFLAKLNTSYYMLLNNMITIPKVIPLIIAKDNGANEASCAKTIRAVELKPDDTILHNTIFEFDNLKICSEKVGRHVLKTARKVEKVYDEEDSLIALCFLEWLQCQIQKDYYPNAKVMADLIRFYIMKIPCYKVRKRALNIFGELLSLHPPHTVSLRKYYICVFSDASSDQLNQGNYKAWEFISSVIEKALTNSSANEDCDPNNELCHSFLSFIIHILEMDLIYYNDRPVTIKTLVCYRIFWPTKMDNPSVVNFAVKNLLRYWIQSIGSDEIVRNLLTRLLCILLEMLWKWSEFSNPLHIAEWPLDRKWMPVTNEILVKFRGFDDISPLLQFLKYIEVPWQRLLLSSLMYRVVQPSFKRASLTNIKYSLRKSVYECRDVQNSQMNSTRSTPHPTITEVLSIMFVSYIDSSGQKFCRDDICHQFKKSLKKEVLDCNSQEKEESTLKSSESSSLKRKQCDDSMASTNPQSTSSKIQQIVSENISLEYNGITRDMVIKMLDVFNCLPNYVKSFEGYRLKCSHINDARMVENLHNN